MAKKSIPRAPRGDQSVSRPYPPAPQPPNVPRAIALLEQLLAQTKEPPEGLANDPEGWADYVQRRTQALAAHARNLLRGQQRWYVDDGSPVPRSAPDHVTDHEEVLGTFQRNVAAALDVRGYKGANRRNIEILVGIRAGTKTELKRAGAWADRELAKKNRAAVQP
jgi:hypothetical protein